MNRKKTEPTREKIKNFIHSVVTKKIIHNKGFIEKSYRSNFEINVYAKKIVLLRSEILS
jgi:hypothetical protein